MGGKFCHLWTDWINCAEPTPTDLQWRLGSGTDRHNLIKSRNNIQSVAFEAITTNPIGYRSGQSSCEHLHKRWHLVPQCVVLFLLPYLNRYVTDGSESCQLLAHSLTELLINTRRQLIAALGIFWNDVQVLKRTGEGGINLEHLQVGSTASKKMVTNQILNPSSFRIILELEELLLEMGRVANSFESFNQSSAACSKRSLKNPKTSPLMTDWIKVVLIIDPVKSIASFN